MLCEPFQVAVAYGTAVQHAVSQGPRLPTHPAQPYTWVCHGRQHRAQGHLSLPMNPGHWASPDKTTCRKQPVLMLTMVQYGQC